MTTSIESIECVICSEYLADPRTLPCGHSYCGPPRLCLTSMENSEGGLCCAVCRTNHNLKAGDIKPLYGIRDFLHGVSELRSTERKLLPCPVHESTDCSLWCKTCDVMICVDCIADLHDGHPVRKLRSYLVEKVESQFGRPLVEGVNTYREELKRGVELRKDIIAEIKIKMTQLEEELESIGDHIDNIDDFCEVLMKGAPGDIECDAALLADFVKFESSRMRFARFGIFWINWCRHRRKSFSKRQDRPLLIPSLEVDLLNQVGIC